jgi:hypothetical protein
VTSRRKSSSSRFSGGFLGKDDFTRPATDEDRVKYKEAYAEFKKPPEPKVKAK